MLGSSVVAALLLAVVLSQAGCAVHSRALSARAPVALRLGDGTVWGSIPAPARPSKTGPSVTATFEADGGVSLRASQSGARLSTAAAGLDVYLPAPRDFGLGFTSSRGTPLRVEEVSGASALLTPAAREDAQPLRALTPVNASCGELRLDPERPAQECGELQTTAQLRILERRGGPPAFDLAPHVWLHLLGVSAGHTRVQARLEDGARIDGWVRGVLRADKGGTVGGIVRDTIVCWAFEAPPRDCSDELHLLVTDGARVEELGTLDPTVFFDVHASDGVLVQLTLRDQFFALAEGWRLAVRAAELERCSLVPPARAETLPAPPVFCAPGRDRCG